MSKKEKLLNKLVSGPRSVTFEEILTIMNLYGFERKETAHGFMFVHPKLTNINMPHVPRPHGGNNKVKLPYVKECIKVIELLGEEG